MYVCMYVCMYYLEYYECVLVIYPDLLRRGSATRLYPDQLYFYFYFNCSVELYKYTIIIDHQHIKHIKHIKHIILILMYDDNQKISFI